MGDRIDQKDGFFAIYDRFGRYFGLHASREGAGALI